MAEDAAVDAVPPSPPAVPNSPILRQPSFEEVSGAPVQSTPLEDENTNKEVSSLEALEHVTEPTNIPVSQDTVPTIIIDTLESLTEDNVESLLASFGTDVQPLVNDGVLSTAADFGSLPLTPTADNIRPLPSDQELMDIAQILSESAMEAFSSVDTTDSPKPDLTDYIVDEILSGAEEAVADNEDVMSVSSDVPANVTIYAVEEVEVCNLLYA
jgi:hypothetical protein